MIEPRRQSVDKPLRLEEGRALCRRGSGGWAPLVRDGREVDHEFDDRLVAALASLIDDWSPTPPPGWVTAVPSLRTPQLVDSLARRVAERLGLPYRPVVRKLDERPRQETQRNSAHQRANVAGAFAVDGAVPDTPVLLLDDLVDSRWTITEVGGLLRAAGSGPVHPVALASSIG